MTNNYEEYNNAFLDDDDEEEELRTILNTPENQVIDTTLYDDNNFNYDDCNNLSQQLSCISNIPVINECTKSSVDADEIPFDSNEWQIIDLRSGKKRPPRQIEFLELLLENPRYNSYISWLDKDQGLFKILQPDQVAALWRKVKCRQTAGEMDYDTFSRGIRYYYQTGSMIKTYKKYTFCFNKSKI